MLNNLMVGIFSQYIHMSNHHGVHFKDLTILSLNYLNKIKKIPPQIHYSLYVAIFHMVFHSRYCHIHSNFVSTL